MSELIPAGKTLLIFVNLIGILFVSALGVLIVLHYMEQISPGLCIAALVVFMFNAFTSMWLGIRHLK